MDLFRVSHGLNADTHGLLCESFICMCWENREFPTLSLLKEYVITDVGAIRMNPLTILIIVFTESKGPLLEKETVRIIRDWNIGSIDVVIDV